MANVNNPNGFSPYGCPYGGNGQPIVTEHVLHATNSEIGVGSPVSIVDGGVNLATAGTGNALCGIAAEYKAASSGGYIKVWSDPQQEFVAQTDDGTGTATAESAVGLNINFIGTGVSNRRSTAELDESSATTGATVQFKVQRLSGEIQGNAVNVHGEFNRLVVLINNHQFKGHTGTVGV
jgi:hypothetical protein